MKNREYDHPKQPGKNKIILNEIKKRAKLPGSPFSV
ncbi:hypothetical protein EAPG_02012 [Escherichia albertii B156]|nr:hypothetical protein EAPG_02012 [Escherichia albertii B156]